MSIKNHHPILICLCAGLIAFNNCYAQAPAKKPNIVFILIDDMGWGELTCYGNKFNETPNIDHLATQGIRFTNAYAAAPVCSPTRASIMTGQWPARIGITDFLPEKTTRFLDPAKYITINEALKTQGYHTGMIGKWHLDTDYEHPKGSPKQHGFDEVIATETSYIAGGDYFYPYDKINTIKDGAKDEYLTDRESAEAVKYIERNKDKPFYLYLAYYSVHARLDAPKALVDKYKARFDDKYGKGMADSIYGSKNKSRKADHIDNPYMAAMVERIDIGVASILKSLKDNGLADNTLVVLFSDNGGDQGNGNNGILRAYKTWLYEGGIRDCLIMRWPGKITPDKVTDVPVSSIDFYPTLLSVAGVKNPPGNLIDGTDISPFLTKNIVPARDTFFWHYPAESGKWPGRMASAVRKGDYKLLKFYKGNRYELYNLKDDPSEKKNLYKQMPEKGAELKQLLDNWLLSVNAEKPDINAVRPKPNENN